VNRKSAEREYNEYRVITRRQYPLIAARGKTGLLDAGRQSEEYDGLGQKNNRQ